MPSLSNLPSLRVRNDELHTVREAMRELNRLLDRLDADDIEKLVLTHRNRIRAVVLSVERFSELEGELDAARRMPSANSISTPSTQRSAAS